MPWGQGGAGYRVRAHPSEHRARAPPEWHCGCWALARLGARPGYQGGVRRPRRGAPEQHSEGAAEVGGPRRQRGKRRRGAVAGHGDGGREQWQGEATAERAPARWGGASYGMEQKGERRGAEASTAAGLTSGVGTGQRGSWGLGDADEEEEGRRG